MDIFNKRLFERVQEIEKQIKQEISIKEYCMPSGAFDLYDFIQEYDELRNIYDEKLKNFDKYEAKISENEILLIRNIRQQLRLIDKEKLSKILKLFDETTNFVSIAYEKSFKDDCYDYKKTGLLDFFPIALNENNYYRFNETLTPIIYTDFVIDIINIFYRRYEDFKENYFTNLTQYEELKKNYEEIRKTQTELFKQMAKRKYLKYFLFDNVFNDNESKECVYVFLKYYQYKNDNAYFDIIEDICAYLSNTRYNLILNEIKEPRTKKEKLTAIIEEAMLQNKKEISTWDFLEKVDYNEDEEKLLTALRKLKWYKVSKYIGKDITIKNLTTNKILNVKFPN